MIVLRLKLHGVRVAAPNLCVAVQKQAFVVCDPVKHLPGEKDRLESLQRETGLRACAGEGSSFSESSENKQVLLRQQIPRKVSAHTPKLRKTSVLCSQDPSSRKGPHVTLLRLDPGLSGLCIRFQAGYQQLKQYCL